MSGKGIDRILDTIDAGLQTPMPDPSFGEVSPRNAAGCVRCDADLAAGGDDAGLCDGCRAFLLGDSDLDPSVAPTGTGMVCFDTFDRPDGGMGDDTWARESSCEVSWRWARDPGTDIAAAWVNGVRVEPCPSCSTVGSAWFHVGGCSSGVSAAHEFEAAAQRVAAVCNTSGDEARRLLDQLADQGFDVSTAERMVTQLANAYAPTSLSSLAVEDPPRATVVDDRRRHGAAAVCPRHGPTRGGLCRRCAR